jgi:hypothetical protein
VIGGKSSSSSSIHERGEERRGEQRKAWEFFFGKKVYRGKRRSKEAKQSKARRSKIEGF